MNVYRVRAVLKAGGGTGYTHDGDPYFKDKHLDQIITCRSASDAKLIMQTAYPNAKVERPVLLLKL